ncbi:hypothetical protein DM860_011584 [Cuscuta australis]|uniref:AIG1-type G domain-containing protein n=1 Tax=Cuscuta australis TaxID=267555 RepID=A0A328D3F5_9ASTE|nr:hypothetical protein DM860_011584 [Cuscuta australis]
MDSKEASLLSSSDVSDLKIGGVNSNSVAVVSDDDDVFLNAQVEPVGEEPAGGGIGGPNSVDPFEGSPVFDVLVNGDDENLNKNEVLNVEKGVEEGEAVLGEENRGPFEGSRVSDVLVNGDDENLNKKEVLEVEKDVEKSEALLEVESRGGEESGVSGSTLANGSVTEVQLGCTTGFGDSEKVDGVTAEVQDVEEHESVGGFGSEDFLEASPKESMPNPEGFANDDDENLNKVDVLEGEKAVEKDEALLLEEKEEYGDITGNRCPDSALSITEIDGLNANASEAQPDGLEGSGVCSENTDEVVNPIREGLDKEKVEETIGEASMVVIGEAKDLRNHEIEGVPSINGTDEIKQTDPSSKGVAVIDKDKEWTPPDDNESTESVNKIDGSEPVMEHSTNVPESVTRSAIISLDTSEDDVHNIDDLKCVGTEKLSDKAANEIASSDAVHSNGRLIIIQNDMEDKTVSPEKTPSECKEEANHQQMSGDGELEDGSVSDQESDGMVFGSSEAARQFIEELERESGDVEASALDGQVVTESEEEEEEIDTDEEGDGNHQLLDSSAIAALLKAATDGSDRGNITITSQDGSRLFSVERPAGLGSSLRSLGPTAPRPTHSNFFTPTVPNSSGPEENLTEEEKMKLEKLQQIRVKFLRLVKRLGFSSDESIVTQVLYRLSLIAGKQNSQLFSIDTARSTALQLETEGGNGDELDFSVNILVLGKCGVGKSSTINSILGEEKTPIDAFSPTTTNVKEICVTMDGVKVRVFDTPALKSSAMEQAFNNKVLSNVKKLAKKNPVDIVLYVDRLDAQTRDLNDLPLLRTITASLGSAIWRSTIVTLTHAASAPPEGPSGSPMSYEAFVTQRSRIVQQSIGYATGDLHMMSPSMMNPVSLVENHPACRRNRDGQKILPNGQVWRPQLLLLCYSMKILSVANSLSKPAQDLFDPRKLLGFRARTPPLPYMLSSMLQSRAHPKLSTELGSDSVDSEIDLDALSDSDQEGGEEEEEFDRLPPFKPLRKAQMAKLSKEQKKAYFEEYDYRVKLLQKKQWREELRRMKEMKKKGKNCAAEAQPDEDFDSGAAAPVAVPLPDMVLPPSFDGDNPTYRYRFLEPTSLFLARPVLDAHGWDHDCGYEGVNIEHSQAIADRFPTAVTFQISKDKKDFSVSLDSSISAKHGETGSTMAGFDIQNIGKQLAYVVRGETKFKNLKKNKTAGGVSVTFIGENVVTGIKFEDQITLGKRYVLAGSMGMTRSRNEMAYGANFELQRREADYPIGQVQSTLSTSVIKWRGDLALGLNALTQFSLGRNTKVVVRAGINNKMSGQVSVRTSSSDNLSIALSALLPIALAAYRKLYPATAAEQYSIY